MDQTGIEKVIGIGIDADLKSEEVRLAEFKKMLDGIATLEDKKKVLWMHIYENALQDRRNSYALLFEITTAIAGNTGEHTLNGPLMAKYIERMSRANDQIIKLAELIQKAQDEVNNVDPDQIWAQIQGE